ncbi:hypothetical protein HB943_05225 [Listeria weihenstephanensis]|uniref:Uncharacterized protein n=1 Tax=Listeria weihenstephanensis TaxID=1006155 RepID=A0A841Z6A9_9LIST|nr:hypothetical protein [Listeria weihenstephanensis]MBC1499997.1 hypothetical protein [Listeria weihenstephanensis]
MKSIVEDQIHACVDEVRNTLKKSYPTLNERWQQEALLFFEKQLRRQVEIMRDLRNGELETQDIHACYERAWSVIGNYLNGKGKLLFVDLETFTSDYRYVLDRTIKQEKKISDFIFQHEKTYVKRLFDKLKESYDDGADAFYYRETELEGLAEECLVFRLSSYQKEFEQL